MRREREETLVGKKDLFHSTLFGGYNKAEVDAHIEELERRIQEYEKTRPVLKELKTLEDAMNKIEELRSEDEHLTREIRIYEAEKEAVSKVLLDAKVNADVIVAKANNQAKEIMTKAEADSSKRYQDMEVELQKEFQRRIAEFVSAKCNLNHCQECLDQAYDQMGMLLDFLMHMETAIPTYLEEIQKKEQEDEYSAENAAL